MFQDRINIRPSFNLSLLFALTAITFCTYSCKSQEKQTAAMSESRLYSFTLNNIDGQAVSLSKYKGKVLLLVNVASRCGFTKQYTALQALYERYKGQGFFVLGFPANNFRSQEPGTDAQIKEFCTTRFNVTFPMFSKISVLGDDIHPLYAYLADLNENPKFGGPIQWNFNKFLIDRNGRIIARFPPKTSPLDPELIAAIKSALRSSQVGTKCQRG